MGTGLIGHGDAVALLRRGVERGRLSHAYLITGPRGVGRRTLALEMAKALECLAEPAQRPCGSCRQCRLVERGVHPDVRLVRRAPERKFILLRPPAGSQPQRGYADNVEFIQADAQLRPVDGRAKVYVILNAEDLSADAANRLLKTLEEPTAYVHFLLTAADRGSVLPTIVSRCQEIRLRPVPRADLAAALVANGLVEPAQSAQLAALAGGRPGWAIAAARDPGVAETHRADVRDLRAALSAGRLERLILARALADRWSSQPDALRATLRAWLTWWRDVLLAQSGLTDRVVHVDEASQRDLATDASRVPPPAARAAERHVLSALADLDANVNARLVLDVLLLRLPSAA